jgi:hypothetical protein
MTSWRLEVLAIAGFAAWCVLIQALLPLQDRGSDFPAFYTAARAPWDKLYDLDYFTRRQLELRKTLGDRRDLQPFPRAPFYALLLKPFGWTDYRTALHVWLALNSATMLGCAWLLRRLYGGGPQILIWMIAFYPISFALAIGQDSALVLGALLLALWFHRQGRDWPAAFFLSLAFQKFHLLLLVPLALWRHGRRGWLARFAACLGFWAALNVALVGPSGVRNYLHVLRAGVVDRLFALSWNIRSLAYHAGWELPGYLLGVLLVTAWFVWLARRLPFENAFWCGVGLSLLLAWHSLKYDYTLAFPFFSLLWRERRVRLAGVCLLGGFWVHALAAGRHTWILAPLMVTLSVLLWRKAGTTSVARHMTPSPEVLGVPEGSN